jgi:hypothetical protein
MAQSSSKHKSRFIPAGERSPVDWRTSSSPADSTGTCAGCAGVFVAPPSVDGYAHRARPARAAARSRRRHPRGRLATRWRRRARDRRAGRARSFGLYRMSRYRADGATEPPQLALGFAISPSRRSGVGLRRSRRACLLPCSSGAARACSLESTVDLFVDGQHREPLVGRAEVGAQNDL